MSFFDAWKLLKPYRRQMAFMMILAVAISVVSAVTPFVSEKMIDNGILVGNISYVVKLALLIILLQVIGRVVEYVQQRCEINISNSLGEELKTNAFEHGLKLKPSYFKDNNFFKTMSDAVYDISSLLMIADNSFLTIFVVICKCVGASVGLFVLDWRLALFVLVLIPIKYMINYLMKKRVEKLSENAMAQNKSYNTWYANVINGITDIKLWGLEKKMMNQFRQHTRKINDASKRLSLLNTENSSISQILTVSLTYVLYIIGAVLIQRNDLTFGGLVAFISFTTYVLLPVDVIMNLGIVLKRIGPNVEGIKRFNNLDEERYEALLQMDNPIETIEFRHVFIEFDGRTVLRDVNLTAHRGEKIAIIGDNGSGKSTLINMLLQFVAPTEGHILINGKPVTEFNIAEYRRHFSVVTQDIHLFHGTVRDNIQLDNGQWIFDEEDEDLNFCIDAVENLENGFDTPVGSDGLKLSGGERQKLAMLRALNRSADVLVLDEPTSNYDAESDKQFNEFISKNHDYGFYFIVTHYPELLNCVNRIWGIRDGTLEEITMR